MGRDDYGRGHSRSPGGYNSYGGGRSGVSGNSNNNSSSNYSYSSSGYHHHGGSYMSGRSGGGSRHHRRSSHSRERGGNSYNGNSGGGMSSNRGESPCTLTAARRRMRDLSSSRERSRERERRRRKAQAECIRKSGGFQKLADDSGHEPINLFWDGFQWVAKTGHTTALQSDPAQMNSTRKLRRLYFGNLPLHLGLTPSAFQDVVWQEMKKRAFCNDPDVNPVLYVWFANDKGNYGFVEFATVEETARALTMDGMNYMGIPLKVSRPNDYSTTSVSQSHAMAQMGQQAAALLLGNTSASTSSTATPSSDANNYSAPPPPPGPPPHGSDAIPIAYNQNHTLNELQSPGKVIMQTNVLKILQVVFPKDVENQQDLIDVLEDVQGECEPFGMVIDSFIVSNPQENQPGSFGDIFIKFEKPEAVEKCLLGLAGRKYLGRFVRMEKVDSFPTYLPGNKMTLVRT